MEMDDDTLATYADGEVRTALTHLAGDPAFGEVASAVCDHLDQGRPWDRAARLALAADYGRLFQGAGGRRGVQPTQSGFGQTNTHGDPWRAMTALFAEAGFALPSGWVEPEDHIGLQLALAGALHGAMAEALRAGDEGAAATAADRLYRLSQNHLAVWVPDFCAAVQRADTGGFYRAVAGLTARLIALDTPPPANTQPA